MDNTDDPFFAGTDYNYSDSTKYPVFRCLKYDPDAQYQLRLFTNAETLNNLDKLDSTIYDKKLIMVMINYCLLTSPEKYFNASSALKNYNEEQFVIDVSYLEEGIELYKTAIEEYYNTLN